MPEQLSFGGFDEAKTRDSLFFALLPDADSASRITALERYISGKHGLTGKPLADRLHISLYSLGVYAGLPRGIVATAREAAATVAAAPFDVAFDRVKSVDVGPRSQALVLGGGGFHTALVAFWQALGVAMAKAGLGRWVHKRFSPHLTLLYDERIVDEEAVKAIGWTVREFVLVDSLQGQSRYIPLGRWPLRG